MLIDLQTFDIVVSEKGKQVGQDCSTCQCGLRRGRSAHGTATDHQGSDIGEDEEEQHEIAIDAMEQDALVANPRDKLPRQQQTERQHRRQMNGDADAPESRSIPKPLRRKGLVCELAADIQVALRDASTAERQQRPAENHPQWKIVPFVKTKRPVDGPPEPDEPIRG